MSIKSSRAPGLPETAGPAGAMNDAGDVSAAFARVKPLAALLAAIRLTLNNQDTRQVALLGIALAGRSQRPVFARFAASPTGQKIIAERRSLVKTLDDHGYLATLPENSLGRHYLGFMRAQGLSAQGLMEATPALTERLAAGPDAFRIFSDYTQRGSHDIYHVLGGYGRDELGETCVLAMAYEHLYLRVYKVISTVGPFVVRKHLRRIGAGTDGVFAAVREARLIGKSAVWLGDLDVEAALPEDLASLRLRLKIGTPRIYQTVIARIRSATAWREGPFAPPSQPA